MDIPEFKVLWTLVPTNLKIKAYLIILITRSKLGIVKITVTA